MSGFRTAFYKLLPPWLTSGEGELVAGSLALLKDAYLAVWRASLEARFPSRAGASALALIGGDRGIFRGRSEAQAHYVARLKAWRWPRGHRVRGSAFALLEQISEYWGGMYVETRDVGLNRARRTAFGVESFDRGVAWDWDGNPSAWSRFWPVLWPQPEHPEIKAWPSFDTALPWGGAFDTAGVYTFGQQGVTPADVAALCRLFKPPAWKPAGTRIDFAVVVLADHDDSPPTLTPGGTWGTLAGRIAAPSVVQFWRITP